MARCPSGGSPVSEETHPKGNQEDPQTLHRRKAVHTLTPRTEHHAQLPPSTAAAEARGQVRSQDSKTARENHFKSRILYSTSSKHEDGIETYSPQSIYPTHPSRETPRG